MIAAFVAIAVIAAALDLFLNAGEEQGLVPDEWDPDRAAPFVANFLVVAASRRPSRSSRTAGLASP